MEHKLGADLIAHLAPPTTIPFDLAFASDLGALAARAAAEPRNPSPPTALPTADELQKLWGLLYAQLRILRQENLDDRAFLREMWDRQRARGRVLAKHLFDIWISVNDPPRSVLEIGCRTGLSLVNKLLLHPTGERVFCTLFDIWREWGSPGVVLRNLRQIGVSGERIRFCNGDSRALVPALKQALPGVTFDYVLVDGSHLKDDARIDLENALGLVAPGGWLVFDDTGPSDDGGRGCDLITVWNDVMARQPAFAERHHYDVPYGFAVARRAR